MWTGQGKFSVNKKIHMLRTLCRSRQLIIQKSLPATSDLLNIRRNPLLFIRKIIWKERVEHPGGGFQHLGHFLSPKSNAESSFPVAPLLFILRGNAKRGLN